MSHRPTSTIPVSRFDYDLPRELIAQNPVEPRDSSRLMIVHRSSGDLEHRYFHHLPLFLQPGDLLVGNNTRVMKARLFAHRRTGGRVEFLLLSRSHDGCWLAMARPGRRLRENEVLAILDASDEVTDDRVMIVGRNSDGILLAFDNESVIERHGRVPLPPYIDTPLNDPERYQTVYSSRTGSSAAPTAGLHFTPSLIEECRSVGAEFATVTLHVGLDTFQPIKATDALLHEMHSEWYEIEEPAPIVAAVHGNRRIIAVGTTSVRTLESAAVELNEGEHQPIRGATRLYITPGYDFAIVDAMVTNFHLPRTTLMLMVAAFAGEDLIMHAYREAVRLRYRFYSFGDAMLIV